MVVPGHHEQMPAAADRNTGGHRQIVRCDGRNRTVARGGNPETQPVMLQQHCSRRISQCDTHRLLPTLGIDDPKTLWRRVR